MLMLILIAFANYLFSSSLAEFVHRPGQFCASMEAKFMHRVSQEKASRNAVLVA